jgi:hypothetical protein
MPVDKKKRAKIMAEAVKSVRKKRLQAKQVYK